MNSNLKRTTIFSGITGVNELIRSIRAASLVRLPVDFGVKKVDRVSIDRTRKSANSAAVELLNSLPDDFDGHQLTDSQRQVLASYTGLGGIGGTEYEYYTPQHVAEGMWDIMKAYGADTGNVLEPAAATGVFQETKPKGVVATAAEISDVSGRINQLLHPEDQVLISPFEKLAASTNDDHFDCAVGNVPFGSSRGGFAKYDPAYSDIKNVGVYFILRMLDKIKPSGMACIIVPYGMTSGKTYTKLREQVSRKAEFLGAHRLPSGTFEENGTATAVDVWVLRKHPADLAEKILMADEGLLATTKVLWGTFRTGKWFDLDGRKFLHGESSIEGNGKFKRLVVKNNQLTSEGMRKELAHKFDSRIDWKQLELSNPQVIPMADGDKRFINGRWYKMEEGKLVFDASTSSQSISIERYGVDAYSDIATCLSTQEGILSLKLDQVLAIASDYPEAIPQEMKKLLSFSSGQLSASREKSFRGSVIGQLISQMQDMMAGGYSGEEVEQLRTRINHLINAEIARGNNPHSGRRVSVSGFGSADWLKFKASVDKNGEFSDLMKGTLDTDSIDGIDTTDHEAVVRHLFNQIDLDPVTPEQFRSKFTGELPDDDNELLDLLASKDGVAISADGNILPMDRATSGDIGLMSSQIMAVLPHSVGATKDNYLRQLDTIKSKRKWTEVDDISFSLTARWMDRRLILEFLKSQGFDELKYVERVEVEDGQLISDLNYSGKHGVFIGYRNKTVLSKEKDTGLTIPQYKRVRGKDGFSDQFENYLNGVKPRGVNEAEYMGRIKRLEDQFNDWIRQHDEIDALVQQYNDAFNAFIPYEHSSASLGLSGISGKRVPFGYQNSEVRRLSEDGKGILGFGTGLGKTTTGLALEAFNYENGRGKRTAFVVPKSVIENWYHEASSFYSKAAFSGFLFVGIDEIFDDEGQHRTIPVLDSKGKPELDKETGNPRYKNAVKISSSATVKERMNAIPQSNYRSVVMTKEQYAAIPLRAETVESHAYDVLFAQAEAGRVNLNGETHSEAKRKNKILADGSDTGSQKTQDFPYFEDMGFDNVIVDEGHNYRNSYSAGREASMLAYLPTSALAKSARDMAVKNAYLMKKNNGRGAVMLTATPLVNSPIDAFNMLSHIVPMEEWQRMGIYTPDDFVKVFGMTEYVQVQKISGEIENKLGLVGFQNLSGLRGIFHRWTTLKTAKDVSNEVDIPDVIERTEVVPMTEYQQSVYEELRERASKLSSNNSGDDSDLENDDSVFAIIRDMDRVCTDPDLYRHTITFRFPLQNAVSVNALASSLSDSIRSEDDESEGDDALVANADAVVREEGDFVSLVVSELYEKEVISKLAEFGLSENDISHPIPPKYSKLIDNLKSGMKSGGKQIIFSDEKSQHEKLRRIIAQALSISKDQIGILNATTVAAASKSSGKKLRKVKRPADPKEDATPEQLNDFYRKKAAFDEYVASVNEVSLGGVESIAADYNEGRTPIIICNKKAEVGINLHIGTTDMHHLTLPWTPASINQRNGRGARVGSKNDSGVNAHYYCGEGSFDEFRLDTLKRKKDWINDILTSSESKMSNADASTAEDMQLLLSANPEERERKRQEQIDKAERAALVKAKKRAEIDLNNYIKASHANAGNPKSISDTIERSQNEIDKNKALIEQKNIELDEAISEQNKWQKKLSELNDASPVDGYNYDLNRAKNNFSAETSKIRSLTGEVNEIKADTARLVDSIKKQSRIIERMKKSSSLIKRLKPEIKHAIESGYIDIDVDVIDHADEFFVNNGRALRKGKVYNCRLPSRYNRLNMNDFLVRLVGFNIDSGLAKIEKLWCDNEHDKLGTSLVPVTEIQCESDYSENEVELKSWMFGGVSIKNVFGKINRKQFVEYLKSGDLLINDGSVVYRDGDEFGAHRVSESNSFYSRGKKLISSSAKEWLKINADKIVYPDSTDEILKTSIALSYRRGGELISYQANDFLRAMFGMDHAKAINDYGEMASKSFITSHVASFISGRISENNKVYSDFFKGTESSQLASYFNGKNYNSSSIIQSVMGRTDGKIAPAEYKNPSNFIDEYQHQIKILSSTIDNAVMKNSYAEANSMYISYKKSIKANVDEVVARTYSFANKTMRMNYPLTNSILKWDVVSLFSDATNLGFISESDVSVESFIDFIQRDELMRQVDSLYTKSFESESFWDELRIATGMISKESIEQAKEERERTKKEQQDVKLAQASSNLTVKTNSSVVMGGRGTNRYNYPIDTCYCLNDSRGKSGTLFSAKDELKEKYNAKYYNGRDQTDDLAGSWWLISKEHDINTIMAVISAHE
ncbi:MAG: Eco57I restriction-modification methylase domain-containing protein [Plesiomonas sp.]|uniref:Eco57I restriction-modification methylase domain-containing protein n=1 Tax=Plesiomonas sp. TaxID=2486279 RepID=UPI003F2AD4A3